MSRGALRLVVSPLVASAALAACSAPEPPVGDFPPVSHDAAVAEDASARDASSSAELVPDGTWLVWNETSTCVKVLSTELESVTETLLLAKLESSPGGVVRVTSRACLIEQTPIVGVATSMPLALVETIPSASYVALLGGTTPGSAYTTQRIIELWGLRLTEPEVEPLPKEASDPRVYDQDHDGNPGVTLVLGDGQCSMYVVQRAIAEWSGAIESATRIAGTGSNITRQVVLGATGGFCSSQYQTRNPPGSARFALERIDGRDGALDLDTNRDGELDCAEVRAYGTAAFGPRAPDNARCVTGGD